MKYETITKTQLNAFSVEGIDDKFILSKKNCPNKICINLPFVLDEEIATLAGMMPDGSLIKDIKRIFFGQKKDLTKHDQFERIIKKKFNPTNKIFRKVRKKCGTTESYTNSTVLCHFLHYILDFKKSNEELRIPKWIFKSPDSVKRAYIHEAYAMEGTILKKLREIRFITKDHNYAKDIQRLLLSLSITSFVNKRYGGTHNTLQYRISVYRKENFREFKKIGFSIPMHVERFERLCEKYGI